MDAVELEVRSILDGWTGLNVADYGAFVVISGRDPHGTARAGSRADAVSLAHDLAALAVASAPEPEPVNVAPDVSSATLETADAAPDEPSAPQGVPTEDDGGSSFLAALYEAGSDFPN